MTADRDARIRERAYYLWLEEGQPHGRDREHWRRAESEVIAAERSIEEERPPAKPIARRARPPAAGSGSRGGRRAAARPPG
jgi:hypothetical protein